MSHGVVAIVGRPNVGKSSLFNCLAGRRLSIVEPTAGVTRDRVTTSLPIGDRTFELIDTGGMGIEDSDNLTDHVEHQIRVAIQQADLLLFLVDGRTGINPLDEEVASRLRGVDKPVLLVVNKCDVPAIDLQSSEFYKLGFDELQCVSAMHHRNKQELLDWIKKNMPKNATNAPTQEVAMKLAIVGRRNTGKSTFINALAEGDRVIVSEVPGTTRDSVDVRFERDGLEFIAIDTAGVRRKHSLQNDVEFYSLARSERSIRRADVVLLFFDSTLKVSKVDKQLAEYILKHDKPAVFVCNKWDLMKPLPTGEMADYLRKTFPSLDFVPIAFVTAKTGRNVHPLLNLAQNLHKQSAQRIPTGELNRILRWALDVSPPPLRQNRRAKIYYATQVDIHPPTIVFITNGPELISNTYQRYLLKTFRDHLGFTDVPVKLVFRRKGRDDREAMPIDEKPLTEQELREQTPKGKSKTPGVWDV